MINIENIFEIEVLKLNYNKQFLHKSKSHKEQK